MRPRSKEHIENMKLAMKKSGHSERMIQLNKTQKRFGEKNPAWVEKTGFELYKYQCKLAKRNYIKEKNIICLTGNEIKFKISLETAYKIGMNPDVVGSKLIMMTKSEAGKLQAFRTNSLPKKKKNRDPLNHIKEFRRYHAAVYRLTKKIYIENETILNPNKLIRGKQNKTNNNYHLDHKVPINICWKEGIMGELCASPENLQLIPWRENISKNGKLLPENQDLLDKFKKLTKEYNNGY